MEHFEDYNRLVISINIALESFSNEYIRMPNNIKLTRNELLKFMDVNKDVHRYFYGSRYYFPPKWEPEFRTRCNDAIKFLARQDEMLLLKIKTNKCCSLLTKISETMMSLSGNPSAPNKNVFRFRDFATHNVDTNQLTATALCPDSSKFSVVLKAGDELTIKIGETEVDATPVTLYLGDIGENAVFIEFVEHQQEDRSYILFPYYTALSSILSSSSGPSSSSEPYPKSSKRQRKDKDEKSIQVSLTKALISADIESMEDAISQAEHFNVQGELLNRVREKLNEASVKGDYPAIITSTRRRRFLREVFMAKGIRNPVLSFEEVGSQVKPSIVGVA